MTTNDVRRVKHPLTEAMVTPLEQQCHSVHVRGPLSESEAEQVAAILWPRPDVRLSVFSPGPGDEEIADLGFLRFFPWLEWLSVNSWDLRNLDGLTCLPSLHTLYVSKGRHKLSAAPLVALASSLRHLTLEGPVSRVEALSDLVNLTTLTLRSVSMPDLSLLTSMAELRGLDLKLDGTKDLSLLPSLTRLRYFEAWMIGGLSDLSPLAETASLEELHLEALKHVTELPPLDKLTRLRRITLWAMNGLRDLSALFTAPALEEIDLRLFHLQPQQITRLASHPTLARATIGMGSDRANNAVKAGLPLPPIASPSLYLALKEGEAVQ